MTDMARWQCSYLISAVIVWVAIIVASAVSLRGTPYFAQMLPILDGGAVWFVVLVPGKLFKNR